METSPLFFPGDSLDSVAAAVRCFILLGCLLLFVSPLSAQQSLGRIVGQLRVTRGDFPPHQIMVELQLHGSTLTSVYADDQGRFGFYNLEANPYHVVINDPPFAP